MEKRLSMEGEELPPPYSVSPNESLETSRQFHPDSWAAELYAHLIAVPDRIRQNRQLRNVQQVETDAWMAGRINRSIINSLIQLGNEHSTPLNSTMVIVPEAAVPGKATWSEMDELKRRGEMGYEVRVDFNQDEKGKWGDHKKTSHMTKPTESRDQTWDEGREFDDWGRWDTSSTSDSTRDNLSSSLWFKDEDMARRLATYIELPEGLRLTRTEPTSSVQEAVEQQIPAQKKSRGWGWGSGRRRNNVRTELMTPTPSAASLEAGGPRGTVAGGDVAGATGPGFYRARTGGAEMDVTAEQVAFRSWSPMGLLENLSGWAIIVKVKVY